VCERESEGERERREARDEIVGCKHVRCSSAVARSLQTVPTDVSVPVHELLHTTAVTTRLTGTCAVQERSQNA
jgi:hypothetical protein